ncbi:MAG: hypothetical protein AB2385_07880 [Symbiobacterium sp.]|uniref:hypothetical protein n=1 Tax=Symbiobacterium sp. TaxID=1971213 RepID=UPI003464AD13
MGWWNDDAFAADVADDRDCGCDDDRGAFRDRKRRRRLIPIGDVTVDCTPVTFRTPGQAFNLVSCPVSKVVPGPGGRPCVATINTPPLQIPSARRRKHCGCG